ncbi:MAG: tRNA (N(6)-L-threonylcarbamoyladenosine(37)-C(2))-methylthiotransferase MtaB [Deltaproteobacteria bacterium]|nr:tRNA (N(6)-L-threonylcarbamoyladenosine(37)-C(2))-methylthiotransferase MtaB [Deltaproteobacteria bacterium]
MKCHVATFGCRVNQADAEALLGELERARFQFTSTHEDADLVVIQSCTVTHRSDADIRKLVSRIERENPRAKVIVAGCYAQRDPAAVSALSGVHGVVGHASAAEVSDVVARVFDSSEALPIVAHRELDAIAPEDLPPVDPVTVLHDRTRPFVKIQDGCDAHCTYCIIPAVRGRARSARHAEVVRAVETLVLKGYFEIVLAGVHLGTYSDDGVGLTELVEEVLAVPGLGRLRLSCIEPMAFPMAIADLATHNPKLAPHFHLPLQSGSDSILKKMGRPYRGADYIETLQEIRRKVPRVCLGTDVIVGFPGESSDDFEATKRVCADSVDYVHAFSYSARAGAASTRLAGKIDPLTIKTRNAELRALSDRLFARHLEAQVGRALPVITLSAGDRDTEALSDNYCPVRIEGVSLPANLAILIAPTHREGRTLVATHLSSELPPLAPNRAHA